MYVPVAPRLLAPALVGDQSQELCLMRKMTHGFNG